jgi:hypothetical protein
VNANVELWSQRKALNRRVISRMTLSTHCTWPLRHSSPLVASYSLTGEAGRNVGQFKKNGSS